MRIATGAAAVVRQLASSFGAAFALVAIPLAAQAHTVNGGKPPPLPPKWLRQRKN